MLLCSNAPIYLWKYTYMIFSSFCFTLFDYYMKVCSANELYIVETKAKTIVKLEKRARERGREKRGATKNIVLFVANFSKHHSDQPNSVQNIMIVHIHLGCSKVVVLERWFTQYIFRSGCVFFFVTTDGTSRRFQLTHTLPLSQFVLVRVPLVMSVTH